MREAEKTRRLLQGKAQEWVRLEQKGGFLDEAELHESESWLSSNEAKVLGCDKSLYDLIKISREQIEKVKQQEEQQRQRELKTVQEMLKQQERATEQEKKARQAAQSKTKFAVVAFVLAIVALGSLGFGWNQQRKTLRFIEHVVLRTDEVQPDIIKDLPTFLKEANESQKSKNYERAISYYRSIVMIANRLQRNSDPENSISIADKNSIDEISKEATNNLLDILPKHRMLKIKEELDRGNFGKRKGGYNSQDLASQFTGALRETYKAIMLDTAADLNENGRLHPEKETNRVPCDLLKEIENLWRVSTSDRCDWFGNKRWDYIDNCKELNNRSLFFTLFEPIGHTSVSPILKNCPIEGSNLIDQ